MTGTEAGRAAIALITVQVEAFEAEEPADMAALAAMFSDVPQGELVAALAETAAWLICMADGMPQADLHGLIRWAALRCDSDAESPSGAA